MTVAVVGVGAMGEAIVAGLSRGWDLGAVRAVDARPKRQAEIAGKYGVMAGGSAREAVGGADTVVIVVKPHDVPGLLEEIGPFLAPDCLVLSVAAGLTTAALERHLPAAQPVVRAMPNTAALVGEAMTAICPGAAAGAGHLERATRILSAVGRVLLVQEKQMDAVTALSGSGPAYVMYVAEAMIDAGVLLGLPRPTAAELVKQTLYGSSKLLVDSGEHPTVLKENVTSPGGTTIAALRKLDEHGVTAALIDAAEASCARSQELGQA
uniref:Putative pyrroline-5-carboxylate reductase n=1 Tax=termite gut metagenome TaxID=433724 RepID=S0DFW4_9ZZZZ